MEHESELSCIPMVQRISAVLWPSFILAGVATTVFFTVFDPLDLLACAGEPPFSRLGAYTIGFFLFWLLTASSSVSTTYFLRPCSLANPEEQTSPQ